MKYVFKVLKNVVPELTSLELAKLEVLAVYIEEKLDLKDPDFDPLYAIIWGLYSHMGRDLFGDEGKRLVHAKLKPILQPKSV